MLWKTIIKRAEQYVLNHPNHPSVQKIVTEAMVHRMSTWRYLRQIDIRHVGTLRDMLPEAFPKKLQRLPLVTSLNIHGKWRVDATNKES